jgi:hypothetical protein
MRVSVGGGRSPQVPRLVRSVYLDLVPAASAPDTAAIRGALSEPRFATYLAAAGGDEIRAVALYGWNARVSAALMLPAHFAEVATRNAVAEALEAVYDDVRWPWNPTFERSLPNSSGKAYSPRRDLARTRGQQPTTGKVIAELKFAFWQSMFTARHDERVWRSQLRTVLPNADAALTTSQLRGRVYADLEQIRRMRNRIAHHEPIIRRDHAGDFRRMIELVQMRSEPTAAWVRAMEDVSSIRAQRP